MTPAKRFPLAAGVGSGRNGAAETRFGEARTVKNAEAGMEIPESVAFEFRECFRVFAMVRRGMWACVGYR